MKKAIVKTTNEKLKSRSGESIAETLVALLISSLALVMLAGSISAAVHIVKKTRDKLDQYYAANEYIAVLSGDIKSSDSGYASKNTGKTIEIYKGSSTGNAGNKVFSGSVTVYENKVFDKYHVQAYAYRKPQTTSQTP